jgi:ABC-2 type transport system permease protein
MELRLLLRSSESLLVTFGIPLGVLVFFSVVDVLPTGQDDPVAFLVPGVLAISVVATGLVAIGIQTAFERKYAVLKRLGGTPLGRGGYLVAKALAVAALLVVQTLLVVLVAVVGLGWRPAGGLVLATGLVVLGAVMSTSLGLLLAGTLRAEATIAATNAVFLVLLVVSGVMVPVDVLPAPLAAIGALSPMGALSQALSTALSGEGLAVVSTVALLAWTVVAVAVGARTFRWEP